MISSDLREMGNCVPIGHSDQLPLRRSPAAVVIHHEGRVLEYKQPIMACQVVARHPGCFLCSVESMHVDSQPVRVGECELLFPGNITAPVDQVRPSNLVSDVLPTIDEAC